MDAKDNSEPFMYIGSLVHSTSLNSLGFIVDGTIVVSGGKIVFLKSNCTNTPDIQKQFNVKEENVHKLKKNQFFIPGFIDTHIHGPQYPNVGLGYDVPLLDWLETYTFPLEKKFENKDFAEKVYNAVVRRTLANGTTTACYFATIHKNSSVIFANCAKVLGQRAFIGKVNMNKNPSSDYRESYEDSVRDTKAFVEEVQALESPLVKPIITPRFALSCDMKLMKALSQMATEYQLPIQTHVSENLEEIKQVKEAYPDNKNYVDVYDSAGLVNNKTILAHGIHLDEEELDVIKRKGATISHCALSNLLLGSGICPVRRYLDRGIKISLGTDCSGGSSCSMLETIRQTLLLSIAASFNNNGKKLYREQAFYLATLGGAEALNLQNITGNFEVGKDFDAILVDLEASNKIDLLEQYDLHHLFQKFIYLGDETVMTKVFVAGRVVKDT